MEDDALQIELPHGPGSATRLDVPPDARLSADTALWVIESLTQYPFIAAEHGDDWGRIRALAEDIEVRSRGWYLDVSVGKPPEGSTIEGSYFDASHGHVLRMHCQRCHAIDCVHRLAFALALAWHDPRWKSELSASAWSRFLEPLTGRPEAPADDERPGGWIRVVLHDRPEGDSEIAEGRVSIQLVPLSRRTNKPLKARRAPRSLEATENKVRGLAEGDRNLLRLVEQHRLLDHVATYRYADSRRVQDELARIERDIFGALDQVTEVFFDDRPLKIDPQPWCTALRVSDGPHGGLELRWAEAPRAIFPAGDGFVIDHGWRLRPLDPRVSIEALNLLERTPPEVPAGDIDAFVDRFVLATAIPVEIRARRLPLEDGTPTPRLVLRDDGGTLGVGVRFAYGAVEVDDRSPPVVRPPFSERRVLIRRDRAKEREARRQLRQILPDAPLRGEVAYDFLLDGLAQLDGWEITADKSLDLRKLKPVGTLETQTRLQSGMDWFDLQVAFQLGDATVSRAEVLRTWKEGRRYVELKDGGIARLPETWLQKHGETLVELDEMRGRRKRIGAHGAAVAEELLVELGADEIASRWRDLAQRIRQFEHVPERDTPPGLEATLRDYQHRGYRWMAALSDLGLGGVLADDMGLGKTLQTLTVLLETHQPKGRTRSGKPSLVVAPTSVVHNWISEAARFAPKLRIHLHHGPKRGTPPIDDVDIIITSFALLRVDAEKLCAIEWRYAVLDEAQHIKNPASRVAQAARDITAEHKLALTGTPLENHLIELWSIFEFLMPGFFGSRRAFQDRYVKPIQRDSDPDARAKGLAHLRTRIRPFVLRRLKREVADELPPRQEQILYCELGPAERRLYEAVKTTYRDTVMGQVDSQGLGRSTIQILEALTRLRQASCDPTLLPFPEAQSVLRAGQASAKRALLRNTLAEAIDEGHRALVFSQWPSLLKRVITDLDKLAIDYLYLDGSTRERSTLQSRWNDPDGPPVFLISLKAGGTGLNLIGADVVVHLDPWWNPQVEAQATDRAHRIGQTKPVMVYKLVARGTVEEKILELQDRKRSLFEAAVDGDRVSVDALTRADLEAVLAPDSDAQGAADELGDWEEPVDDDLLDDSTDGIEEGADDSNDSADDSDDSTDDSTDSADDSDDSADDSDGPARRADVAERMAAYDAARRAERAAEDPSGTGEVSDRPRPPALPRAIAERLYTDGKLVNSTVREVLGCTSAQATARLKRWTKQGLLTRRGRRQNTRYLPPE